MNCMILVAEADFLTAKEDAEDVRRNFPSPSATIYMEQERYEDIIVSKVKNLETS